MKYKKDKTHLIQVRFSAAEVEDLDQLAADAKRTRSEIIRNLIKNERMNKLYGKQAAERQAI
jgi:hypothetical protein